jgi:MFS family permease
MGASGCHHPAGLSGPPNGAEPFRVRSLSTSVYLPNLLFSIGQGAATPVIALLALDLGASPAVAGGIVALLGIGTMVFDIPAGALVARVGERRAMVLATVLLVVVAIALAFQPPLAVYAVLVFGIGCAWSVWALARLSFATEAAPLPHRGRVMSMMGGTMRIGQFIGPLLGGIVVIPWGLAGPFHLQAIFSVAAVATLALAPGPTPMARPAAEPVEVGDMLRRHRRALLTAGSVAIALQVLRSARQAIIPLWGDHIGLGASQISLIFGVSSGIEMAFFYPVGMVMDRRGRKWAAIPSLVTLSVGMTLVPLTSTFIGLLVVGVVLGFGNGLGSGVNMTLGSDLSPSLGRSHFLGIWRLIGDVGTAGGPLLVAVATSLLSLAFAPLAVAGVGIVGAAVMWRAVPETLRDPIE